MVRDELFAEILSKHGPALWRIARSYSAQPAEAEDLHQEILLQVWRSLDSYRGDSALGTWVYRVALNTALTNRRQSRRREAVEVVDDSAVQSGRTAGTGSPARILEDFLDSLEPIDRSVMLLYAEGLSHEEIGQITGLSRGAAAVRLHRLKQRFVERYVEA